MPDAALRRTPCVGICSTTYGDLVCRGCKRFAHEVANWNGYGAGQRDAVSQRLETLRDGSVGLFVRVADEPLLRRAAAGLRIEAAAGGSALGVAYETLRRVRGETPPATLGLQPLAEVREKSAAGVFAAIDREFLARSQALYERSFRIPAQ